MNKFELKGEVVAINILKGGKATLFELKVVANNRTEIIPVLAFNKLSDVVAYYTKIGEEVVVNGALRLNNQTDEIDLVAFKVTKVESKDTKNDKKSTKIDKKSTKIDKKDNNIEKSAIRRVKKLDKFDGLIVNVFENISKAAEDVSVKKSDMKKAIANETVLAGYRWSY